MVSLSMVQDLLVLIVTVISPAGLREWPKQHAGKVASASSVSSRKNLTTMVNVNTLNSALPTHYNTTSLHTN